MQLIQNQTVTLLDNISGETDSGGRCQIADNNQIGIVDLLSISLSNQLRLVPALMNDNKEIFQTLEEGGSIVGHLSC